MTNKPVRVRRSNIKQSPSVIGWREWVALPHLGVAKIKTKVDTGARTSAIHAFRIQEAVVEGKPVVRFVIKPFQHESRTMVSVETPLLGHRHVRSSNGKIETRPVILATVELDGQSWKIEVTLTRRDEMGFRMLLGRQAIRGRFLVDSGRSFVTNKQETKSTSKKEEI